MNIKPALQEIELNAVPNEKLEYNSTDKVVIFVDDVNECRWKITFITTIAMRMLSVDIGYNFNSKDFKMYYYKDSEGTMRFHNYIFEIDNSNWINALKKEVSKNMNIFYDLDKSKHYLVVFYDYELEIIANRIELEKYI